MPVTLLLVLRAMAQHRHIASALATGQAPDTLLEEKHWLWFQKNLSPELQHELHADYGSANLVSIHQLVRHRYARSVAVVNASAIEEFLIASGSWSEDFVWRG